MNEAEILIEKLMNYYGVFTISELGKQIDTSQPSISQWKKNNYVKAIATKCKELGIYEAIFIEKKPKAIDIEKKDMISLLDIFSQEELDKLNKTANESNIPLTNLLRLGISKLGLL